TYRLEISHKFVMLLSAYQVMALNNIKGFLQHFYLQGVRNEENSRSYFCSDANVYPGRMFQQLRNAYQ
ncbi:MAG: hypothetical protein WCD24_17665, partial [Serratia inhibens]|uniref:hypothetical protein n=1 Tax=Serratia inhibens TaxID=2338073 RepID=UPI003C7A23CC